MNTICRDYDVSLIRTIYFHRSKKSGDKFVGQIGLTYCGKKIDRMEFLIHERVRYYNESGDCIGSFQDKCGLDD